MFTLTFPLMLMGLAALPALAAIYWLRNRFRRQPVSSLMLWLDHHSPREGGARVQRLTTPLIFFLELLALALLALAATEPRILTSNSDSPLVLVLDDSFSMQATHEGQTVQQRAIKHVQQVTRAERRLNVRVLLAGRTPRVVGQTIRNRTELEEALQHWQCQQPAAAMEQAVALAADVGGPRARILVFTDRAPDVEIEAGPTKWRAFGQASSNLAIVTAVRKSDVAGDRVLIEVANLSANPGTASLTVRNLGETNRRHGSRLSLDPGETYRTNFQLEPRAPAIEITIDDDALAIDNRAVLLPEELPEVSVQMSVRDEALATRIRRAIDATGRVRWASGGADLLITDDKTRTVGGQRSWPVYLLTDAQEAQGWTGPFIVDHGHPLTEGLSLAGVVWGAPGGVETSELPGTAVVATSQSTLISDSTRWPSSRHELRIALVRESSTLQDTTNWPVLWWNLVAWRASELPGLRQPNARLGDDAMLVTDSFGQMSGQASGQATNQSSDPSSPKPFTVTTPSGETRSAQSLDRRLTMVADQPGVWQIASENQSWSLAVNALSRDESDLRLASSGSWGDWLSDPALRRQYADTSWMLLGLVAALLTAHLWMIARSSQSGGSA